MGSGDIPEIGEQPEEQQEGLYSDLSSEGERPEDPRCGMVARYGCRSKRSIPLDKALITEKQRIHQMAVNLTM